ncbi:uncharacterized protein [Chelonus insularis]|uniref:uncharacterized protein n=1 Tax=Chelonus insularis TaxID=460826 RepID=UPI00158C1583|nr:uncharacterized protein LOC118068633 [Chelonus insularis]
MFPPEIWEKILQKIKCPEDLGRLKLVCKDWNIIIEKIIQQQILWDDYCFQEMTEKCMFHLVNQINEKPEEYSYDVVRSSDPMKYNKIWREVYCYWKTWPLFINHRVFIDKLSNLSLIETYEQITHLDVYRDFIGIVTNENRILFYNISDLENIYYKVYISSTTTVQFTFWKTENADILALARSHSGVIHFWDVILKKPGIPRRINEGDIISICLEKCYVVHDLTVTRFAYVEAVPALVPVFHYVMQANVQKDLEFMWKLGFSHYFSYIFFPSRENLSIWTNAKFYTVDEDLIAVISDTNIRFLFTEWYSRNKWREYNLFNSLHGKIQYLCYHCRLLIFGLDSGSIYIFHVKKNSDLESFDFSPTNGRKIIVDTKPIIFIRVIDFKKRKIIVAATHDNVHFINFLSD